MENIFLNYFGWKNKENSQFQDDQMFIFSDT